MSESNDNIFSKGVKQMLIQDIKKNQEFVFEDYTKVNGYINMSKLYIDGCEKMAKIYENAYNNKHIEEFKEKESRKQNELINWSDKYKNKIDELKKNQSEIANMSLLEGEKLVEELKLSYNKEKNEFEKNLKDLKPISIDCYIKQNFLENDGEKVFKNHVTITIVGRRGSGKSSIINAFRNLSSFDEKAAETNEIECTYLLKYYIFENNEKKETQSKEEISFLDFPGFGTDNFPSEDYVEILLNTHSDVFIYLFSYSFNESDFIIFNELKSKSTIPVFLVQNKIDVEFENYTNTNLDDLDNDELNEIMKKHWEPFRKNMLNILINDKHFKYINICDIKFISAKDYYRSYFDFKDLIEMILNNLPKTKSKKLLNILKNVFKGIKNSSISQVKTFLDYFTQNTKPKPANQEQLKTEQQAIQDQSFNENLQQSTQIEPSHSIGLNYINEKSA